MNYKEETIQVDQDSRVDKLKVRIWKIKVKLSKLGIERPWVWYRDWFKEHINSGGEDMYQSEWDKLKSQFHRVYNLNGTDETITTNLETMIEDLKKG